MKRDETSLTVSWVDHEAHAIRPAEARDLLFDQLAPISDGDADLLDPVAGEGVEVTGKKASAIERKKDFRSVLRLSEPPTYPCREDNR